MEQVRTYSKWLIAEGIILIIIGFLAIIVPYLFTLGLSILIGSLMIVGGIAMAIRVFRVPRALDKTISTLLAIAYLLLGGILAFYPIEGSVLLTILVFTIFIVEGITKIILGFQSRPIRNWGWLVISGLLSLAMAAIIWYGWPQTSFWVIGLLFGINLIFVGSALIAVGSAFRSQSNPPTNVM